LPFDVACIAFFRRFSLLPLSVVHDSSRRPRSSQNAYLGLVKPPIFQKLEEREARGGLEEDEHCFFVSFFSLAVFDSDEKRESKGEKKVFFFLFSLRTFLLCFFFLSLSFRTRLLCIGVLFSFFSLEREKTNQFEMSPTDALQVIHSDGTFDERAANRAAEAAGLPKASDGRYGVVAVMGPQSSGKSTLLNAMVRAFVESSQRKLTISSAPERFRERRRGTG